MGEVDRRRLTAMSMAIVLVGGAHVSCAHEQVDDVPSAPSHPSAIARPAATTPPPAPSLPPLKCGVPFNTVGNAWLDQSTGRERVGTASTDFGRALLVVVEPSQGSGMHNRTRLFELTNACPHEHPGNRQPWSTCGDDGGSDDAAIAWKPFVTRAAWSRDMELEDAEADETRRAVSGKLRVGQRVRELEKLAEITLHLFAADEDVPGNAAYTAVTGFFRLELPARATGDDNGFRNEMTTTVTYLKETTQPWLRDFRVVVKTLTLSHGSMGQSNVWTRIVSQLEGTITVRPLDAALVEFSLAGTAITRSGALTGAPETGRSELSFHRWCDCFRQPLDS